VIGAAVTLPWPWKAQPKRRAPDSDNGVAAKPMGQR
jgi:hypothetical protein